jgi:hypothetical protein
MAEPPWAQERDAELAAIGILPASPPVPAANVASGVARSIERQRSAVGRLAAMPSSPLKRFGRRIMRPVTRPIDGRVADINRRVGDTRRVLEEHDGAMRERFEELVESDEATRDKVEQLIREIGTYATTATESNAYVGVEMRRLEERLSARVDGFVIDHLNHAAQAPLKDLDGATANLLNRASGHQGFAAETGLWFNPPVTVELSAGQARLGSVNERIVEVPFAFGALSRLNPPARILEVGSAESTFALSLASLGYQVTAVDLNPLPYSHPNLNSIVEPFEDWDPGSERFDATFLISTIEHVGLGAYGEPSGPKDADRATVARVGALLNDGGFMVLTTPYGRAAVDGLERVYDEDALSALLHGWTVVDRRTVLRRDDWTWIARDPEIGAGKSGSQGVAMVIAVPTGPA